MANALAELWNGNLEPIRYFGTNNREIRRLEALLQRNLENLEQNLDENSKKFFEKI